MNVNRSVSFGVRKTGLSTVGYQLINTDGSVKLARTTSGISELVTGSGVYGGNISFDYSWDGFIVWDTGEGSLLYASENFNYDIYRAFKGGSVMQNIVLNKSFTQVIPLPTSAGGETYNYKVYKGSDASEFATGTLTFVAGVQWKMTFTPDTLNEIYIIEVTDADSDVVFSQSYKAVGVVSTEGQTGSELTTVDDFKTAFDIDTAEHDTLIQRLITQLSAWCSTFCGRDFVAGDHTEYYDGDGSRTLFLRNYPINSIASIYDDPDRNYNAEDLIDSGDIEFYDDDGQVCLFNGIAFTNAKKNIKITYNAGYSTYPADLVNACENLVMADYIEHIASINTAVSDEIIYKPDKLRTTANEILERYKKYV